MTATRPARFWSPAWRSRPDGHRHLRLVCFLLVGIATLALPALAALLVSVPFGALPDPSRADLDLAALEALYEVTAVVMFLTIFAPFYGLVLVPLAMASLAVAMRFGFAGWAVAGLSALVLAALLDVLIGGTLGFGLLIAPVTLLHALVLWGATRWLLPDALLPAPE